MATLTPERTFHNYYDVERIPYRYGTGSHEVTRHFLVQERSLKYDFFLHKHPYTEELVRRLLEGSVTDLQAADTDYVPGATLPDGTPKPVLWKEFFAGYAPDPVVRARPVKRPRLHARRRVLRLQLGAVLPRPADDRDPPEQEPAVRGGAAVVPLHLRPDRRQRRRRRRERFWKVRPFQTTDVELIESILVNLATGADAGAARRHDRQHRRRGRTTPFRPHVVARYRPSAYMFKTVMAYLDNLIAWGDSLFRAGHRRGDQRGDAAYVLAANILGPRPQAVPAKGTVAAADVRQPAQADLDAFGNALRELEADVPFDLMPHARPHAAAEPTGWRRCAASARRCTSACRATTSCSRYWDTVADRLFKIRNSLNIQGVFRQLPLFEPPIDPALLARAAAAGLDVARHRQRAQPAAAARALPAARRRRRRRSARR